MLAASLSCTHQYIHHWVAFHPARSMSPTTDFIGLPRIRQAAVNHMRAEAERNPPAPIESRATVDP